MHRAAKVLEEVNRKLPLSNNNGTFNFYPSTRILSATMHSVTDRQTDRQTDDIMMP